MCIICCFSYGWKMGATKNLLNSLKFTKCSRQPSQRLDQISHSNYLSTVSSFFGYFWAFGLLGFWSFGLLGFWEFWGWFRGFSRFQLFSTMTLLFGFFCRTNQMFPMKIPNRSKTGSKSKVTICVWMETSKPDFFHFPEISSLHRHHDLFIEK